MDLLNALQKFKSLTIGVIGDLMLDHYVIGDATRISPEAPAPVVLLEEEKYIPGGAANTAVNIASLGGHVELFGRVGNDEKGLHLAYALKARGIGTQGFFRSKQPTITKTRIVARGQQIVRLDHEIVSESPDVVVEKVLARIDSVIYSWRAAVVSDYEKGFITRSFAEKLVRMMKQKKIPLVVDTKPSHAMWFRGADLFTPNKKEASEMSGIIIRGGKDIIKVGKHLQKKLASNILITQGAEGMTLFYGKKVFHFPSTAREVYEVTGAGDTVAAVFALALASSCSYEDGMKLASAAAGIVVCKQGTATVFFEELSLAIKESKLI